MPKKKPSESVKGSEGSVSNLVDPRSNDTIDKSNNLLPETTTDKPKSAEIDPSTEPLYIYNGKPSTEVDITSVIASSNYSAGYCPDITRNGVGYDYQSGRWKDEEVLTHPAWFKAWNRFVAKLNGPKCDKCGAMTAGIGNVGWCRTCDREQGV